MSGDRQAVVLVSTEEQLRVCLDLGIHLGQGFYFAAPAAWETIRGWKGGG